MKRVVGLFLYFTLSFLVVFFIAGWVVKLLGIGANQGLAAGAMVLFYAFIIGIIGLIAAVLIYIKRKSLPLLKINLILLVVLGLAVVLLKITPKKASEPVRPIEEEVSQAGFFTFSSTNNFPSEQSAQNNMGLGLFTPRMLPEQVLYFYERPHLASHNERLKPIDSIAFEATAYGGLDIGYQPKWLEPHYVKLDYDMLLFKVNSVGRRYIELTVNESQNKTLYVQADSGTYVDWNLFITQAHSVELLEEFPQKIKSQPIVGSKTIFVEGDVMMIPNHVKGDWLFVEITDLQYNPKGQGWIQWKKDGKLLIRYQLLS